MDTRPRLPLSLLLGYGVGSVGTGMFTTVPGLLLLYFMTDTLGIPAGMAGWAVFVPKLWDVLIDPLVGTLSDRTRSSLGRRRPYLLAGGLLLPVFFAALFSVPVFESHRSSFLYVAGAFLLAATAFAVFQVPYLAMPAEMTRDYHERTTLMSYRMAFLSAGILVGGAAAPLLVQAGGGGRKGYAVMGLALGGVCLLTLLGAFFATRRAPRLEHVASSLGLREQLRVAAGNRPFFVLLAGYFVQLAALSCLLSAVPFYAKYVLHGNAQTVTILFACLIVPALAAMPFWNLLSRRLGKLGGWVTSISLFALINLTLLTGSPEHARLVYVQVAFLGLAYAGTQLFPFSMLPDTIHADQARSGLRREGAFTGVWTANEKTAMALGALLAGLVLDFMGFVESVPGQVVSQPASAILGVRITMALLPPLLLLLSLPLLRRYDLSPERLASLDRERPAVTGGEA